MKRVPPKKKRKKKGWIEYDFTENSNNKKGTLSSVILLMKVEMFLFKKTLNRCKNKIK